MHTQTCRHVSKHANISFKYDVCLWKVKQKQTIRIGLRSVSAAAEEVNMVMSDGFYCLVSWYKPACVNYSQRSATDPTVCSGCLLITLLIHSKELKAVDMDVNNCLNSFISCIQTPRGNSINIYTNVHWVWAKKCTVVRRGRTTTAAHSCLYAAVLSH